VLVPFDRPHLISYSSAVVKVSLSCAVSDMLLLIYQNLKKSHDPECTTCGVNLLSENAVCKEAATCQ